MRVRLLVAVEAEAERIQQLPHDAHFGDDELEPQVRSVSICTFAPVQRVLLYLEQRAILHRLLLP
jgi:hypothetical protein